jgi:hemolysin III
LPAQTGRQGNGRRTINAVQRSAQHAAHSAHDALYPVYRAGERLADTIVQSIGLGAAIVGAGILMGIAFVFLPAFSIFSLAVYSAGLIAMLAFSLSYNRAHPGRCKEILRRLDHAAIFVMIAGTYTPFALLKIGGFWGYVLFAAVWAVAGVGVFMKLVWPRRFERLSIVLYLAQGWAVVGALGPLLHSVSTWALILLGIGGTLYTIGVVFHLWRNLPYQNAVWHGFVIAAAACHYAAIFDTVHIA